jgi:hypothetical protein
MMQKEQEVEVCECANVRVCLPNARRTKRRRKYEMKKKEGHAVAQKNVRRVDDLRFSFSYISSFLGNYSSSPLFCLHCNKFFSYLAPSYKLLFSLFKFVLYNYLLNKEAWMSFLIRLLSFPSDYIYRPYLLFLCVDRTVKRLNKLQCIANNKYNSINNKNKMLYKFICCKKV